MCFTNILSEVYILFGSNLSESFIDKWHICNSHWSVIVSRGRHCFLRSVAKTSTSLVKSLFHCDNCMNCMDFKISDINKMLVQTCWIGSTTYYICRILGKCNKVKGKCLIVSSVTLEDYLSINIFLYRFIHIQFLHICQQGSCCLSIVLRYTCQQQQGQG